MTNTSPNKSWFGQRKPFLRGFYSQCPQTKWTTHSCFTATYSQCGQIHASFKPAARFTSNSKQPVRPTLCCPALRRMSENCAKLYECAVYQVMKCGWATFYVEDPHNPVSLSRLEWSVTKKVSESICSQILFFLPPCSCCNAEWRGVRSNLNSHSKVFYSLLRDFNTKDSTIRLRSLSS